MGLFYAYAKNVHADLYGRYVIIFSSRKVADEWWRTLQDKVSEGKLTFSTIQRVTPQFYLHDQGKNSIATTLTHPDGAPEFMGKIIFSPQIDGRGKFLERMDIIPIQDITDHVSGNFFFIRSRQNPIVFWHYDPADGGYIKSSSTGRTKFRISIRPRGIGSARLANNDLNYNGKIMTGSDNVEIALAYEHSKYVCTTPGEPDEMISVYETQLPFMSGPERGESSTQGEREGALEEAPNPVPKVSMALVQGQGTLRVGNRPETFRFRDLLDGLSDEWELA